MTFIYVILLLSPSVLLDSELWHVDICNNILNLSPLTVPSVSRTFDVVLVEKGVILVLLREMFRYELKEGFADVSFHVAAERRVVPDNYYIKQLDYELEISIA